MKIEIKQLSGMTLVGKSESKHMISMDASESVGGGDAAIRPMELVLMGLGGCTGMDVISILQKKRTPFQKMEIEIEADRADEHPKVFTEIKVKFLVFGDPEKIKTKDVERAIDLSSNTYCSASAMLSKTAKITYSYEIINL